MGGTRCSSRLAGFDVLVAVIYATDFVALWKYLYIGRGLVYWNMR